MKEFIKFQNVPLVYTDNANANGGGTYPTCQIPSVTGYKPIKIEMGNTGDMLMCSNPSSSDQTYVYEGATCKFAVFNYTPNVITKEDANRYAFAVVTYIKQ